MTKVKWFLLHGGYCIHPEKIILPNRPWKKRVFPALFSLIEHPSYGLILFDTGYAHSFFTETASFPYRLYRYVTPVSFSEDQAAVTQLKRLGYSSHDVKVIILSHLHADHISGVKDFPSATFFLTRTAYDEIAQKQGFPALKRGFVPSLLPHDFLQRVQWIDHSYQVQLTQEYSPFTEGYDLLHDQSIIAVDLPGHAAGQIGLFFYTVDNETVFLLADSCWTYESYHSNEPPHHLTHFITHDPKAYRLTLERVHQFAQNHPQVRMIPSHCIKTWNQIQAERKK